MRCLKKLGLVLLAGTAILVGASCVKKGPAQKTVWVYTSIYKHVIAGIEVELHKKFPDVKFEWFQSGSENVAARLNAELSSGRSQADLILTSDPLWYLELKKAGHLLAYQTKATEKVASNLKDPEGAFATVRIPVAVLVHHAKSVPVGPKSWKQLEQPQWKGKISMASPLESGTSLLLTSQLVKKEGWSFFEKLRKNEILSAGGNSAVISRLETGERAVGIVLLENALEAKKKNSPLEIVYPQEGAILVPSPIAILAKTREPELVKQVYDYFFSDEVQKAIVAGNMYSPVTGFPSPEGAKPFSDILANAFPWNPAIAEELFSGREATKKKFSETVLN